MNNVIQKIFLDAAIEYTSDLLTKNENEDLCIGDLYDAVIDIFIEFDKKDVRNMIKDKCVKDSTKDIIDNIIKIDDSRCNSIFTLLVILLTEETKLNSLLTYKTISRQDVLCLYELVRKFKNIQQFVKYIDFSIK